MKVKLEESKNSRRLHIGSFFTDLNESEYQELVKIFSKDMTAKEKAKGLYQKFMPFDVTEYNTPLALERDSVVAIRQAKVCVDELISDWLKYKGMYEQEVFDWEVKFWQEVKSELENL